MLEIEHLQLHYGAAHALRDVGLIARAGAITCVMGRNGVGKTSLMRAIMGQLPVTSGNVRFAGTDITTLPTFRRVELGLAYVPQGREIFPLLSVEENLLTALAAVPAAERQIPEQVWHLFPVLRDMLGRRGGDLSGGQQQQLAIARALTTRPQLLILDEPTEGIQPSIIKDIAAAIAELRDRSNLAVLLVEQYFDFAQDLADHFVVMERGEVVMNGTAEDIDQDQLQRHLTV